ncbi:CmcJ/NvfI family oxidoreductase [Microbulbifer sp. S227A]|uniref:CmcJ/NvfI family oxidoreductase n=1 Tax=Microbulbifer sp. S227A TaxID=3415131 RepID=UPI003C7DA268
MSRTGTVNYHVHKPERQAFHIDAGGVTGAIVAPELIATEIGLRDLRDGGAGVTFEEDGISYAPLPSAVKRFDGSGDWQATYDGELTAHLIRELGASEVVVFDHTVRIDDPQSTRRPARNVHSDYSREGAQKRLRDILGDERAAEWERGRYAFVNVWRPIDNPINTAPLGFVRPSSVAPQDWVLIDLIYPDRRGHIMGLAANERHDWLYLSRMTPDEVVAFNIYDSFGHPSVGHSAVDLVEDPGVNSIRKSIETRTLLRF